MSLLLIQLFLPSNLQYKDDGLPYRAVVSINTRQGALDIENAP